MSRSAHTRRRGKRRYLLVDEIGGPLLGHLFRVFLDTTRWAGDAGDPVPVTHNAPLSRLTVRRIRRERAYARDALRKLGADAA